MVRLVIQLVLISLLLAGEVFAMELVAEREFSQFIDISSAKISDAAKDSIVGIYGVSNRDESYFNIYRVSGSQILLMSSNGYLINNTNTNGRAVTNPTTGKLLIGGYFFHVSTTTYPYLVSSTYSGGAMSGPAEQSLARFSLPAYNRRSLASLDHGDFDDDGTNDIVYTFTDIDYSSRICVDKSSGSLMCYILPTIYDSALVKAGKFAGGKYQIAVVGSDSIRDADVIKLLAVRGAIYDIATTPLDRPNGLISQFSSAAVADLDGDGNDELIIGGAAAPNMLSVSDAVWVYGYSGDTYAPDVGWVVKAKYINATQAQLANSEFVGTMDVDSDGKLEIVAVNRVAVSNGFASTERIIVNTYKYDGTSQLRLLSTDEIKPANPSSTNYYRYNSAATGDYLGNGRGQLAVVYGDTDNIVQKMGVYKIEVSAPAPADTQAPTVAIAWPANGETVPNSGNIPIRITATDNVGVTRIDANIKKTGGGFDSNYIIQAMSPDGYYYLYVGGFAAGEYTLTADAKDAAGNVARDVHVITITTAAPAAADMEEPFVQIITPAEGATVATGGTLSAKVQASDNIGLQSVTISLGKGGGGFAPVLKDAILGADGYYHADFDLSAAPVGEYTISAEARDAAGNRGIEANGIIVTTAALAAQAGPAVSIISPVGDNFANSGVLEVKMKVISNLTGNLVVRARFTGPQNYNTGYVTATSAGNNTYTSIFNIDGLPAGAYTITAGATDAANHMSTAEKAINLVAYQLPAAPDMEDPTVQIITPAEGAALKTGGTLTVQVYAADNIGVQSVTILLGKAGGGFNSGYKEATRGANGYYTADFDVSAAPVGEYTISAEAKDAAGNRGIEANGVTFQIPGAAPAVPQNVVIPPAQQPQEKNNTAAQPAASGEDFEVSKMIATLEIKISIAKQQGINTADAEKSLNASKAYQKEGKYVQAATEANNGELKVGNALKAAASSKPASLYPKPPCIGSAAIALLVFAAFAFGRKNGVD